MQTLCHVELTLFIMFYFHVFALQVPTNQPPTHTHPLLTLPSPSLRPRPSLCPQCIIIWDALTGMKKRGFEKAKGNERDSRGAFRWSFDDKYFARVSSDAQGAGISIYETPGMGLLEKKSIKIANVQEVAWSPDAHIISYWVPGDKNTPARVVLMEIPSRRQIRDLSLYGATDIRMYWHNDGSYLAVKLTRQKTKTKFSTNFSIFRLRGKDIPVESFEIDDAAVHDVAWEPKGHMLSLIHGNVAGKACVSFYTLEGKKLQHKATLEQRAANSVAWSPQGGYCVLAGQAQHNGALEFFDAVNLESVALTEHFTSNEVHWDPSGRYVVTAVTEPIGEGFRYATTNGYKLWTMQGECLYTVNLESCYQVLWRPRPASQLSAERLAEVQKSLKSKYWGKFDAEDEHLRQLNMDDTERTKKQLKQEWAKYRADIKQVRGGEVGSAFCFKFCLVFFWR
jgi:translation initiation factor 3 subunit B